MPTRDLSRMQSLPYSYSYSRVEQFSYGRIVVREANEDGDEGECGERQEAVAQRGGGERERYATAAAATSAAGARRGLVACARAGHQIKQRPERHAAERAHAVHVREVHLPGLLGFTSDPDFWLERQTQAITIIARNQRKCEYQKKRGAEEHAEAQRTSEIRVREHLLLIYWTSIGKCTQRVENHFGLYNKHKLHRIKDCTVLSVSLIIIEREEKRKPLLWYGRNWSRVL